MGRWSCRRTFSRRIWRHRRSFHSHRKYRPRHTRGSKSRNQQAHPGSWTRCLEPGLPMPCMVARAIMPRANSIPWEPRQAPPPTAESAGGQIGVFLGPFAGEGADFISRYTSLLFGPLRMSWEHRRFCRARIPTTLQIHGRGRRHILCRRCPR